MLFLPQVQKCMRGANHYAAFDKKYEKTTINLDKSIGLNDERYLQIQYSQLNAFHRNIIIMIDEIYLSKHIEATGDHILGLTDNCKITSTALTF